MNLNLGKPKAIDSEILSKLVFESKASHGYEDAFMAACQDELLVTPDTLKKGPSQIAWTKTRSVPLGFVQIVQTMPNACELEALFIAPDTQGLGIGKSLFEWAITAAALAGFETMFINSDPGAEAFYSKVGAVRVGETPSGSIPGRSLPRLSYNLIHHA